MTPTSDAPPPFQKRENDVTEVTPLIVSGDTNGNIDQTIKRKRKLPVASFSRKVVVLGSCIMLQAITVGVCYALPVMYVEVIREFGVSRSQAALVQSVYTGTMVGGGLVFAQLMKRFGPGRCVVVGSLVGFLGLFVSCFAVNVEIIIVFTGVVSGVGNCFLYFASFLTVPWMFHESPHRPLIILTTGASVGQCVFPYMAEIFISEFQWNGCFLLLSALTLNCTVLGLLIMCSQEYLDIGDEDGKAAEGGLCLGMFRVCDISLCRDPVIVTFLFSCFLLALTSTIEAWFLVDIMVILGFERSVGSVLEMVLGFANFIGRIIGILLHLNKRLPTYAHWIYLCPIVALSHALFINFSDYWPIFGSLVLNGSFFGCTTAQGPAIMHNIAGKDRYPKAIALMNLMYGIGDALGALMGAILDEKSDSIYPLGRGLTENSLTQGYDRAVRCLFTPPHFPAWDCALTGVIKDTTGSYDLVFYIGAAASLYIAIATVGMAICLRKRSNGDSKVSYRKLDDEQPSTSYHVAYTNIPDRSSVLNVNVHNDITQETADSVHDDSVCEDKLQTERKCALKNAHTSRNYNAMDRKYPRLINRRGTLT